MWRYRYNRRTLEEAGLSLKDVGLSSLAPRPVMALQSDLGVTADGAFGPKTLAAFLARRDGPAPTPDVVDDEVPVIDSETYVSSYPHKRVKGVRHIVIHDSVTRSAADLHKVLDSRKRKYSSHYYIDHDGTIYQTMDPETQRGVHAAGWNYQSIGIDMVSMVSPKLLKRKADKKELSRVISVVYEPSLRQKKVADYTPEQKTSLIKLVKYLCDRFRLPYCVPAGPYEYGKKLPGLTTEYLGIVSHAHTTVKRWDGGCAIRTLLEDGAELKAP